uniref:Protein COFACTOR ASSEMBLY OF COMPLEX C SUBUNIT B CCB4, chloroplastic n=1 Tax=Kalanchoe fedtschenkoi TaxID=63787 RepID=A0A7N0TRC5_KALFE
MDAGSFLLRTHLLRISPKFLARNPPSPRFVRCSSELQARYRGPKPKKDWIAEWVEKNDDAVRSLPIYVGGGSLLAVLVNRAVSGIAPVADASSSQSRADLLTLGLAVTNILAGLVWLSIRPKAISVVDPQGVQCQWINPNLQESVTSELSWVWESLSTATCCRSLVIVYNGSCVLQMGVAAECSSERGTAVEVNATKLMEGTLYQAAIKSQTQSYLANLSLYPGRSELPFLPANTQAVILQPLEENGIAVLGGDTVRGFTTSDQAWITLVAEKIEASLRRWRE